VTEAMWKGRPVVASRVGGIASQIISGETGLLIGPHDFSGFGDAVCGLLEDPRRAAEMGRKAKLSAREHFLPDRHLTQWAALIAGLIESRTPPL
jgi:trehalose synthase